jgi:thymidylate synthase
LASNNGSPNLVHADVADLYAAALEHVLTSGDRVSPRGLVTREVLGARLELTNPKSRLPLVEGRVINPAFAVAEAIWILSGTDDPWIFAYNKNLKAYTDRGKLQGAYGPRLRHWRGVDQLDSVRRLLLRDPSTRQAVLQIFDPARDFRGYRDVPCTLNHRFFLRRGRLHMHTTMRSQDLWLGFPYDVFTNTVIHELMAHWVGAELGPYVHTVDSLHLYERDMDAAARVRPRALSERDKVWPSIAVDWAAFDDTLARARDGAHNHESPGWRAFFCALRSYEAWKEGDTSLALLRIEDAPGVLGRSLALWYETLLEARANAGGAPIDGA